MSRPKAPPPRRADIMIRPNPVSQAIGAYVAGLQPTSPACIKLNTNEFPYPAAPEVLEAIRREADDSVRLYPNSRADRLRERLATRTSRAISLSHISSIWSEPRATRAARSPRAR